MFITRLLSLFSLALVLVCLNSGTSLSMPDCEGEGMPISPSGVKAWHNCEGTITSSNGNKYFGGFVDGKPHGRGTFIFATGDKYVGEFLNGKRHGRGTFQFANGDRYVGEYKNGERDGKGIFIFAKSGNKYVGSYKSGRRHGYGSFIFAGGTVREGLWQNGIFQPAASRSSDQHKFGINNKYVKTVDKPQITYRTGSGTGFAVTYSGHEITSNHVVQDCTKLKMYYKGKFLPAISLAVDKKNDLALLKVDFRPNAILKLSRDVPQLMEDIFVAGYPFGRKVSGSVKITKGIVSSLTGLGNNFSRIQIDAAIQPGNSGGPIINEEGNVIGVAVGKLSFKKVFKRFGTLPENINFGIKTRIVRNFLKVNSVTVEKPGMVKMEKVALGRIISGATYYLSCWMTIAQIKKRGTNNAIFSDFELSKNGQIKFK